jgi:hypothetical protein
VASEGDTDYPQEIIFLTWGYSKGDAARNTFDQNLIGDEKAQNDLLLVSYVGLGVAPISARYHSFSQRLGELRVVFRKYLEWLVD